MMKKRKINEKEISKKKKKKSNDTKNVLHEKMKN